MIDRVCNSPIELLKVMDGPRVHERVSRKTVSLHSLGRQAWVSCLTKHFETEMKNPKPKTKKHTLSPPRNQIQSKIVPGHPGSESRVTGGGLANFRGGTLGFPLVS